MCRKIVSATIKIRRQNKSQKNQNYHKEFACTSFFFLICSHVHSVCHPTPVMDFDKTLKDFFQRASDNRGTTGNEYRSKLRKAALEANKQLRHLYSKTKSQIRRTHVMNFRVVLVQISNAPLELKATLSSHNKDPSNTIFTLTFNNLFEECITFNLKDVFCAKEHLPLLLDFLMYDCC
jgi:hypothetical protein